MLSFAEITREGRVRRAFGMLATVHRVRRGCYDVRGIPVGWHSTIVVQPTQLPPGDCAIMCASPQPGPARSDNVIIHMYAAVSLDVLRLDDEGKLRWGSETEAADADFTIVVVRP